MATLKEKKSLGNLDRLRVSVLLYFKLQSDSRRNIPGFSPSVGKTGLGSHQLRMRHLAGWQNLSFHPTVAVPGNIRETSLVADIFAWIFLNSEVVILWSAFVEGVWKIYVNADRGRFKAGFFSVKLCGGKVLWNIKVLNRAVNLVL